MTGQTHILNGDVLLNRIEHLVPGQKIVCRECMIEGNLQGDSLEEFFTNRANSFNEYYGISEAGYFRKTKNELLGLKEIADDDEINLWFEDDLFCQCNFWFSIHLLKELNLTNSVFLVRPTKGNEYNFGKMTDEDLQISFGQKTEIRKDELKKFQSLWLTYRQNNSAEMISISQSLNSKFPFVEPAVYAHISKKSGKPEESLKQIIKELNTKDFVTVFSEFCKRETIYGFGDMQVKRMFDKIIIEEND